MHESYKSVRWDVKHLTLRACRLPLPLPRSPGMHSRKSGHRIGQLLCVHILVRCMKNMCTKWHFYWLNRLLFQLKRAKKKVDQFLKHTILFVELCRLPLCILKQFEEGNNPKKAKNVASYLICFFNVHKLKIGCNRLILIWHTLSCSVFNHNAEKWKLSVSWTFKLFCKNGNIRVTLSCCHSMIIQMIEMACIWWLTWSF